MKSKWFRAILVVTFVQLFLTGNSAFGYVRIVFQPENTIQGVEPPAFMVWDTEDIDTNGNGIISSGEGVPVVFGIGGERFTAQDVTNSLIPALNQWTNIGRSFIAFRTTGENAGTTTDDLEFELPNDTPGDAGNINFITLIPESDNNNALVFGTPAAGVLAVTIPTADEQSSVAVPIQLASNFDSSQARRLLDVDMLFNGAYFGSAASRPGEADLRGVATHEAGHLVGLNHTFVRNFNAEGLDTRDLTPTLFPRSLISETNGVLSVNEFTLEEDDRAGASALYPAAGFTSGTGRISGRVFTDAGEPIFGAHVVAYVVQDDLPTQVVGTLSGDAEGKLQAPNGGSYVIEGLPGGSEYFVVVEPILKTRSELNGASLDDLVFFFNDQNFGADTDFKPMVYNSAGAVEIADSDFTGKPLQGGSALQVNAGVELADINFGIVPGPPGLLEDPLIGTLALLGIINDFLNASTYDGPSVSTGLEFREIRDHHLLGHSLSASFAGTYYGLSQETSEWITQHPGAERFIAFAAGTLRLADGNGLVLFILFCIGILAACRRFRRNPA